MQNMAAELNGVTITGSKDSNHSSLALDATPPRSNTPKSTAGSLFAQHQRRMTLSAARVLPSISPKPQRYQDSKRKSDNLLVHIDDVAWKDWPEVKIRVSRLPGRVSTWDIYTTFTNYGDILRVEIWPNKDEAVVVFSKTITWQSVTRKQNFIRSMIELVPQHRSLPVTSPINPDIRFDKRMSLTASSIAFGFMYTEKAMMVMDAITPEPGTRIEFDLNLAQKRVDIRFPLQSSRNANQEHPDVDLYRFEIPLNKLNDVYATQYDSSTKVLVIPLVAPPEFYRRTKDIQATHDARAYNWSDWQTWFRQTDIVFDSARLETTPVQFRKEHARIDIGRWTTYRLMFDDSVTSIFKYNQIIGALREHNIRIISSLKDQLDCVPRQEPRIWEFLDPPTSRQVKSRNTTPLLLEIDQGMNGLPFEIRYQLEVCLSNGYINEHNITEEFLHNLTAIDASRAIDILERVADLKKRYYNPMHIFSLQRIRGSARLKIPDYCTSTRSVVITPSMVYYSTPAIEISNRVIRHWNKLSDRFLRVRFTDEINNGRINSRGDSSQDEVFNRVTRTLRNGIVLGNRKYEFLACGNSQFREHGAYFFAPTSEWPAEDLRAHLGDLQRSKDRFVPAKWFARLGQNFSTTRGISTHVLVQPILEDIKTHDEVYCFTDGVGKISPQLSRLIAQEFGLPSQDVPSVFQFRLGGCKGVIAISPDIDGHRVQIRPSQYKFAAAHNGLEIIRCSSYVGAVLNRQIISVLSALGVPDDVFRHKMQTQLKDLESAMTDEKVALRELQKSVDFNQMTLTIAGLILDGFMRARDPFMISLLKLWRSWSTKFLKEKAKIPIELGACLLGCVDETGSLPGYYNHCELEHGTSQEDNMKHLPQIFCYVDRYRKGVYEPVQGLCILARNPSLHPGDIRVVLAVDVPHLHHLKNVVVLPQNGDRDLGNMCSGGDLDGDDYLLIWDQKLIPQEWDHPPMDFTPIQSQKLNRVVNINDMTDFFVAFMKNDRLPAIAHAHLAFADYQEDGVKSSKCLRLAQLHSQAVDYNKSGVPATITRDLRPPKWPHFMEKWRKPKEKQYKSTKVLGQLYDIVERVKFVPEYELPFDERILGAFDLDMVLLGEAERLKEGYDDSIKRIMAQHDIVSEFEVWTTFVMSHNDAKRDYSFAEELGKIISAVKDSYRKLCLEVAGGQDHLPRFAAAMYTVTARQVHKAVEERQRTKTVGGGEVPNQDIDQASMPLMSFPWIFETELGKIVRGRSHTKASVMQQPDALKHKQKRPILPMLNAIDTVETEEGIVPLGEIIEFFDTGNGESSSENTRPKSFIHEHKASPQQKAERTRTHYENVVNPPIIENQIAMADSMVLATQKGQTYGFSDHIGQAGEQSKSHSDWIKIEGKELLHSSRRFSGGTTLATIHLSENASDATVKESSDTISPVDKNTTLQLLDAPDITCVEQYGVEEITIDLDNRTLSALDKLHELVGGYVFDSKEE